jgi:hypothetical protein
MRGRGPKGYTRADERIREDVCDSFTHDPLLDAGDIEVGVAGGEVTLAGISPKRDQEGSGIFYRRILHQVTLGAPCAPIVVLRQ